MNKLYIFIALTIVHISELWKSFHGLQKKLEVQNDKQKRFESYGLFKAR